MHKLLQVEELCNGGSLRRIVLHQMIHQPVQLYRISVSHSFCSTRQGLAAARSPSYGSSGQRRDERSICSGGCFRAIARLSEGRRRLWVCGYDRKEAFSLHHACLLVISPL